MAEVLLDTSLDSEQKECAEAIAFSGGVMLTLVNNILDFSKLEADKLSVEKIPFNIRCCIERVMQTLEIKAEEKDLELIADISADLPRESIGDPSRLSQVLLNLVGNAVKFTPKGMVVVTCVPDFVANNVKFSVKDTGIGLLPSSMERIFQPFGQADDTISRQYGGTGLGLVICRQIVSMMGGELVCTRFNIYF